MKQVTGEKKSVLTMRDLQGISHFKRTYKAEDSAEYAEQLKGMNLADMQREAVKCGTAAISERKRLEKNLISLFEKARVDFDLASRGMSSGSIINSDKSDEKRERALEVGKRFR